MNSNPQANTHPAWAEWTDWDEEDAGNFGPDGRPEKFKTLTREQAQDLRKTLPTLSPWRVVAAQAVAGLVCVLIGWLVSMGGALTWSALYGAVAVVVPNALMAWGMTRNPTTVAAAAFVALFVWESIKILLTIAILMAVVSRVHDLSWPALLVTMVVCLKVNWLILLRRGRSKSISDGI